MEPMVLQIDTLLSELRGSMEYPSVDMLCVIVRKTFSQVQALSALFAAADLQGWLQAGSGRPLNVLEAIRKIILDGRDDVKALKDFRPIKDNDKANAMAAALAAASFADDKDLCKNCGKKGHCPATAAHPAAEQRRPRVRARTKARPRVLAKRRVLAKTG